MQSSHYNTTSEGGELLRKFEANAKSQEARLYEFFKKHSRTQWTRSELHTVILRQCPVSSITRALANLKKSGLIERTNDKRKGDYGRPQHLWRFVIHANEQADMFPQRRYKC